MALITDPIDLLLDADTGDLVVTSDLALSTGREAVAQSVRLNVQLFRGEWFANLDAGMTWYEDVLGQKFDSGRVGAAFRRVILNSAGVASILQFAIDFDNGTRQLDVSWTVATEFGDTVADSLTETL